MRKSLSGIAVIVASALLLSGCSRGDGEDQASSNISNGDARVASMGLGDVDTLLALGITPVAIAPWGAEGDGSPSGVGPWSEEFLGDAKPVTIYNTASGFTADIPEELTATDPTHIIAVNQAVDSQARQSLEDIAPTTVKPDEFENWQVPWEEQVAQIAQAVDKEDEGQQLIQETEAAMETFRNEHPELQGKRAAIVMPYEGKIGLYTSGDGRGQFIEDLGFEIPTELEGDGSSFFVDYAPENYVELNDVDYLFVLDYNGALDELQKDTVFQNLEIVRDGRVHYFETDIGNAMSMPNPVTIPWSIDKFAAQLK